MAQTTLETDAAAQHTILVTLVYGATTTRYCRWTSDLTIGGNTYTAAPELEVEFATLKGTAEPEITKMKIARTRSPVNELQALRAHAPIKATISEVVPGEDATLREVFYGRVLKVTTAPNGVSHLVEVEVHGIKSKLVVKLGMPALTTCLWRFGDDKCGFTLTALTGTTMHLFQDKHAERLRVEFSGSPNFDNRLWRGGYVEKDGIRILIKFVRSEGTNPNPTVKLDLADTPPDSWEGASAQFYHGCDKRLQTCRGRNNESQFSGMGIKLPPYHPVLSRG